MKKLLKYLSLAMMVCLLMVPALKAKAAGVVNVTNVTANSMDISWSSGAASYDIGWNENIDAAKANPNVTNFTGTSYHIDNLKSGTKYYIVVKTHGSADAFASNVVATNPGKPYDLTQESWSTKGNVTVSWKYDGNASGFQVVYTDDEGDQASKDIADAGARSFSLDMKDVRYYKVIVRSYVILDNNAKKYGDFSDTFTTFAQPVISETDDGFSVSVKNGKMTVKWEKVNEAQGYEVYVSHKKNNGYKKVKTITSKSTTRATIKKFNGKRFNKNSEYYVYVVGTRKTNGKINRSSSNYVVYYRKGETFIAKKKS